MTVIARVKERFGYAMTVPQALEGHTEVSTISPKLSRCKESPPNCLARQTIELCWSDVRDYQKSAGTTRREAHDAFGATASTPASGIASRIHVPPVGPVVFSIEGHCGIILAFLAWTNFQQVFWCVLVFVVAWV